MTQELEMLRSAVESLATDLNDAVARLRDGLPPPKDLPRRLDEVSTWFAHVQANLFEEAAAAGLCASDDTRARVGLNDLEKLEDQLSRRQASFLANTTALLGLAEGIQAASGADTDELLAGFRGFLAELRSSLQENARSGRRHIRPDLRSKVDLLDAVVSLARDDAIDNESWAVLYSKVEKAFGAPFAAAAGRRQFVFGPPNDSAAPPPEDPQPAVPEVHSVGLKSNPLTGGATAMAGREAKSITTVDPGGPPRVDKETESEPTSAGAAGKGTDDARPPSGRENAEPPISAEDLSPPGTAQVRLLRSAPAQKLRMAPPRGRDPDLENDAALEDPLKLRPAVTADYPRSYTAAQVAHDMLARGDLSVQALSSLCWVLLRDQRLALSYWVAWYLERASEAPGPLTPPPSWLVEMMAWSCRSISPDGLAGARLREIFPRIDYSALETPDEIETRSLLSQR